MIRLFQFNIILLCKHTSKFMGANMEIVCLKATLFFCFWMKNVIEDTQSLPISHSD